MPRWSSGLSVALPSPAGTSIFVISIFSFFSELDIVKVINCFFFSFDVAHFSKKYPTMFIRTRAYRNIAFRVNSQRHKVQITSVLAFISCYSKIQSTFICRQWICSSSENISLRFST